MENKTAYRQSVENVINKDRRDTYGNESCRYDESNGSL